MDRDLSRQHISSHTKPHILHDLLEKIRTCHHKAPCGMDCVASLENPLYLKCLTCSINSGLGVIRFQRAQFGQRKTKILLKKVRHSEFPNAHMININCNVPAGPKQDCLVINKVMKLREEARAVDYRPSDQMLHHVTSQYMRDTNFTSALLRFIPGSLETLGYFWPRSIA